MDANLEQKRLDVYRFRGAMDEESIANRLMGGLDNPIYKLAVRAAGGQSAFTTDRLSWRLKAELPALIARLATEVEEDNARTLARQLS